MLLHMVFFDLSILQRRGVFREAADEAVLKNVHKKSIKSPVFFEVHFSNKGRTLLLRTQKLSKSARASALEKQKTLEQHRLLKNKFSAADNKEA
jgi:hypothetical protein